MSFERATFLSDIVTSSILVLCFAVTLVHVRFGSKYTFLTILTVLMLFSDSLGRFTIAFAENKLFLSEETTQANICVLGFGFAMQDTPFNVVHWLLAWQMNETARRVP